ncbi:MAG: FtsW/RodA/SpoVE family cell cycle protein [Oscillospiraceae bacterium]
MELLKSVIASIRDSVAQRLGGISDNFFAGLGEWFAGVMAGAEDWLCLLLRVIMIVLAWCVVVRCIRSLYADRNDRELWGALILANGARYDLRHWENIIGRAGYADIRLNFACVSRSHATLQRDDKGKWLLYPVSESSRTTVNGERIHEATPVALGDVLSFNGVEMYFFPASEQDIHQQAKRRARPGGGVSQRRTLWLLTLLQAMTLAHFMISADAEALLRIIPAFGLLCAAMWGLYFIYRLFHRAAFELETLAFFLCTVGFAVLSAYSPGGLLKQFAALCIGLVLFLALSVALRSLQGAVRWRWPLAAAACALLTFNVLFGQRLFGAKNWISIGPLSFQPSELVKVAFVFAGAATLDRLFSRRNLIFTAAFSCFCVGCLALMSDFGTALIFFVAFLAIAFLRSGDLPSVVLVTAAAAAGGWVILQFKPYIAQRFAVWRHVWEYTDAGGYQQSRTMAAIADGGLFGKGPADAWLKRIGAANTDLVFGVVSEEFGLLMALAVVAAIVAMTFFAVYAIRNARSSFYVIAACAAATMLAFQSCLNIFGATDLLPLTGVTLPFVSVGGSSMMSCWALLAFLKAADTRKNASFILKRPSLKRAAPRQEEEEERSSSEQERIDSFDIDWSRAGLDGDDFPRDPSPFGPAETPGRDGDTEDDTGGSES